MKNNRFFLYMLLLTLVVSLSIQPVMANSPPPEPFCVVQVHNLPQEACFVDLLVPLTVEDKEYCIAEIFPEGITFDSQIVSYYEDGYMSYTFHYKDASSQIKILRDRVIFFEENYTHSYYFKNGILLKLAVLDYKGDILQISQPFKLDDAKMFHYVTGGVSYDGTTGETEIEQSFSLVMTIFILFLMMVAVWISVGVEVLVAKAFQIHKTGAIITTNLITQILMRFAFYTLLGTVFTSYVWLVILLEIVVYAVEFVVYRKIIKEISFKRILVYTIVANTASLLVGILVGNIINV